MLDKFQNTYGYVEEVSKWRLSGWIVYNKKIKQPLVNIIQDGEIICSVRAKITNNSDIIKNLNLNTSEEISFRWNIPFPLAIGVIPDKKFNICFDNGKILNKGNDLQIPLTEYINSSARNDLETGSFIFISDLKIDHNNLCIQVACLRSKYLPVSKIHVGHRLVLTKEQTSETLNKKRDIANIILKKEDFTEYNNFFAKIYLDNNEYSNQDKYYHNKIRTIWIPKTIFDTKLLMFPLPENHNIKRVSRYASKLHHIIGGSTTFLQLNEIVRIFFNRKLDQFHNVLDWGVGCGRIIRQFSETGNVIGLKATSQNLIGMDVDSKNINWCNQNLGNLGKFYTLSLKGFNLNRAEIDLLFGISVMTHLTEHNQYLWLKEIARIVKPGGCVILTIHGEFAYYYRPNLIAIPFIEQFGFFDNFSDNAIGNDKKFNYRTTYHSRGYVKENWNKYFEILDFIPVANSFFQDFVVMRRNQEKC